MCILAEVVSGWVGGTSLLLSSLTIEFGDSVIVAPATNAATLQHFLRQKIPPTALDAEPVVCVYDVTFLV